nr:hypothetical protein [Paraprevotella clara]
MEYQYNIAGHLCRIVFCDAGNDSSLLPSFSPFESEEEGNLLFCLSVDDAFRWPVTGEEVGQFDCGGNNFGVYRLSDGSYQFEICDEKKALCCLLQANADFSDCTAALVAESDAGRRFGLNNALMLVYAFASAPYATLLMHASVIRNDGWGYLFLGKSGTGKSTHTRLWLSHIPGSDLMNDDNPVVRVVEGWSMSTVLPGAGKHLVTAGCLRRWELLYSCGNVRKTRFGKRAYWKVLPRSCRPYRP